MEQEKKIAKEYNYEDETGKLLFLVARYEPKGFIQRRPSATTNAEKQDWIYNTQGVRKVLYRLPELLKVPDIIPVIIVAPFSVEIKMAAGPHP
jgi:hypothetical protein